MSALSGFFWVWGLFAVWMFRELWVTGLDVWQTPVRPNECHPLLGWIQPSHYLCVHADCRHNRTSCWFSSVSVNELGIGHKRRAINDNDRKQKWSLMKIDLKICQRAICLFCWNKYWPLGRQSGNESYKRPNHAHERLNWINFNNAKKLS